MSYVCEYCVRPRYHKDNNIPLFSISAVSYGKYCGGVMMDDPTACTHTCPMGEMKTCEHGGICTCGQYQLVGI